MSYPKLVHPVGKTEASASSVLINPPPITPPYLTEQQFAELFLVKRRTVREWRERGYIPFLKVKGIIRFDVEACKKALEKKFVVHGVHVPKRCKPRVNNVQQQVAAPKASSKKETLAKKSAEQALKLPRA